MTNNLYLDNWIKKKIGLSENQALNREDIEKYQLEKIKENIEYTVENSPFYRNHLANIKECDIRNLSDVANLPFTTQEDIIQHGLEMLCVSNSDIGRIVTLETSGTMGEPKKLYFTDEDQILTIDYFSQGMKYICNAGDRVLVLLPCKSIGSVGNLLEIGLDRIDVEAVCYGPLKYDTDFKQAMNLIESQQIDCIVGTPSEVLELARRSVKKRRAESFRDIVGTLLLTGEYVSVELSEEISETWDCRVYEHYGMTEMGMGGAVLCTANAGRGMAYPGYHLREADLYVELVDPHTGKPVSPGEYGEIVFTTLTRKGMPLIRYRTGDVSRWLLEPCKCGSVLKRLDKVRNLRYIQTKQTAKKYGE